MSLFIKIERFASLSRLVQSRSLHTMIGEDINGALVCAQPKRPYFSLYSLDDRCLLQSHCAGISVNQHELSMHGTVCFAGGDKIAYADYTFTIFTTSLQAEILAAAGAKMEILSQDPPLAPMPRLIAHFSGMTRSFPLFPGLEMKIGSSPEVPIFIEAADVMPEHCSIQNKEGSLLVKPLQGRIAIDGRDVLNVAACAAGTEIFLPPSKLILTLERSNGSIFFPAAK